MAGGHLVVIRRPKTYSKNPKLDFRDSRFDSFTCVFVRIEIYGKFRVLENVKMIMTVINLAIIKLLIEFLKQSFYNSDYANYPNIRGQKLVLYIYSYIR